MLGDTTTASPNTATSVGEVKTHYALIWYDSKIRATPPGSDLHDVRFTNDIVVSRTGWGERSSVVALRSGTPGNHEHADRNSVLFTAYGERLLHDPFKAAYAYTLPHWVLRKTEAHTAVLIDGKGHQYHDGKEGTNASWAEATVVDYTASSSHLIVSSDATEAYRLVNADVDLVRRTLVFLKPDVLLIYDRIRLKSKKAKVQLRYQVFNGDGKGTAKETEDTFLIERPHASLRASVLGSDKILIRTGRHAVPEDVGIYPYVEVEALDSLDHRILTVCTAQEAGEEHGKISHTATDPIWTVKVDHNGQSKTVGINVDEELPRVSIV